MNSRERVIRAIEFTGPDRVPFEHAVFPGAFHRHGMALVELLNQYPDDFGNTRFSLPQAVPDTGGYLEEYRDEWGSLWVRLHGYTTGEVKQPALPTWEAFRNYEFPPLPDQRHFDWLKERLDASHEHYASGGGGNLFERMQFLRGSENLYYDLGEDRAELYELADRLVEYYLEIIKRYLAAGVDGVRFADDWGGQYALLISPEQWQEFFKPRYRKMFEPVKDAGKHIFFHTDGWTLDILEDLYEIGVDVLNPQHALMGEEELSHRLGGRACFRSDLDRQYIIPRGTPEEIDAHVKQVVEAFGRFNGGLILHGEIGPDAPLENIRAMYAAFRKYGGA
jgi:hypothetical protein